MPLQHQNSLPYYEIFREYLESKYPLGVDDYLCFLRLLSPSLMYQTEGYKIMKEDLLELCKTLWLKPDNSVIEFENIFNKGFSQLPIVSKPEENRHMEPRPETSGANINNETKTEVKDERQTGPIPPETRPETTEGNVAAQASKNKAPEYFRIRFGEAGGIGAGIDSEAPVQSRKFLFTDNYFPVSKRSVYQLFSSLPEKKARNSANVVDIGETVSAIAKQGFFSGAVFRKEEEIYNELIILNDFGGSMVAFEQLTDLFSDIMFDLFKGSDHKEMVTNYYFQNVIGEYLYLNKSSTRFEKTGAFVSKFEKKRVAIIIISDAGAARRSNTSERVYAVVRMLTLLEKITPHIAWLNPVPKEFWKTNTARRIANFVPMFDISDMDLKRASSILRGRQLKTV